MLVKRAKPTIKRCAGEDLAARRKREAEEASLAMKEYRAAQRSVFERMVALRRERLAQLSKSRF
jgi:hypothetical protein